MSYKKIRPSHIGRKGIYTSVSDFSDTNLLVQVLNDALKIHRENVNDMNILIDYYLGKQSIETKVKSVRDEINNKTVVNLAQAAVREVLGYLFGTPIAYVSRTLKYENELERFNDANEFENKSSIDQNVAEDMLITGLGFRCSFPENIVAPDEQPFLYDCIDPRNAFVIRSTEIGHKPILNVIISKEVLPNGGNMPSGVTERNVYTVYSKNQKWVFKGEPMEMAITINDITENNIQILDTLPLEEFRANKWNLGFFETALDLFDDLNMDVSMNLDDIEQKVNSKLVLLGIDPNQLNEVIETKDSEGNVISSTTFAETVKSSDVIAFTGQQGINQDAKFISNMLENGGMKEVRDWLESMYYYVLGLPERKTRGNGGGDTGHAVELRDGWAALEAVSRTIELSWIRNERESIKRVLRIMKINGLIKDLSVTDIDVKFSRNKLDNILSKVQAGQILNEMNLYDPVDITTVMDITTHPQEMVQKGKAYQEERQKQMMEQQVTLANANNLANNQDDVKPDNSEN